MTDTLPRLNSSSQAMGEITRALQTGQQVIAHTDPIQVPGWRGAGYILLDPLTGDGAYKISGGKNGLFIDMLKDSLWAVLRTVGEYGALATKVKRLFDFVSDVIRIVRECGP